MILVGILFSGLLISLLMLGALIRSPLVKHFADHPDHRKVHQKAVPRLGGHGIILAFLILLWVVPFPQTFDSYYKFRVSVTFVSLFLLVAGTLDDIYSLGYRAKFLLQFLLAGVIVSVFHLQFEQFSVFGYDVPLRGMGVVVSMFWIVAIVNAVNIIDGIDGLAAGVALCGLLGISVLARAGNLPNAVVICAALSGTILGFLYYNFHQRHKVFLGDTGSQFLGAMLALLILRIHGTPGVGHSAVIPVLLVAYPVLDTSVAMIRRFLKGRRTLDSRITRMFLADNQHLHHRLVYQGLTHAKATLLLLLLSSGFTGAAVLLSRLNWQFGVIISGYLFLVLILVLARLGFMDTQTSRKRNLKQRISTSANLRGQGKAGILTYPDLVQAAKAEAPDMFTPQAENSPSVVKTVS